MNLEALETGGRSMKPKRERIFCAGCNGIIRPSEGTWIHSLTGRVGCKDANGNYTGSHARPVLK